jgi:DNA helicase-2/ATP-dependent DNA helicase PcrA
MFTYPEFARTVRAAIPRFQQHWLNNEENRAVCAPPRPPTFIVAGPGAGKTTVLVLRVLKLILVDGIPPDGVMATTFTRKAAGELRSRILSWGYAAMNSALENAQHTQDVRRQEWLGGIDVSSIMVGTLDSLAEQFLIDSRAPGQITPTAIEPFLAKGVLRRHAIFPHARHRDQDLLEHVVALTPGLQRPVPLSELLRFVMDFADRVRHDGIDLGAYAATGAGQRTLRDTIDDYFAYLNTHYLADFARLEELILTMLRNGQLSTLTGRLRALLIDEFQDTNYQQEQIYLQLCRQTNASLTVVGDDDQSIHRFRGATVEIFANFQARIVQALGAAWQPNRVDLFRNYRSTRRIVDFCQHFIKLDPCFETARAPGKIPLVAQAPHATAPGHNLPVLGMFRTNCQQLAADLTQLLCDIFRGPGRQIQCEGATYHISRAPDGDFGDGVLLAHSVRERTRAYRNEQPRDRLPLLLRNSLQLAQVSVFNPRGRSLGDIPDVQRLLGLAIECIDPNATILNAIQNFPQSSRNRLAAWHQAGRQFILQDPPPGGLDAFVNGWRTRTSGFANQQWPPDWPLLELIFTLTTWFPSLQSEPEGQVYLEAIARTVSEVGEMASYGAQILHGEGAHDANSVRQAIWEVFEPLASDSVEIDEDIMRHVPRKYFPIMTVHQAKGLEFPLVIVDVGSDFKINHRTQQRLRFPNQGDSVHLLEGNTAPHCPIGALRVQRSDVDRAWDDIRRLYFVAYSRPENVLILAGLTSQLRQNPVPTIAMGDLQNRPRGLTFVPANRWSPGLPPETVALI